MSLKEQYNSEIVSKLQERLNIKNKMLVPKLQKIVLNSSTSEAVTNSKVLDSIVEDFETITGQKAVITKAKKSIAGFKIREGMPLGVTVTLRKQNMYEFLNRLINVALPRTRDFKGLSKKGFDGNGNYNMGIKEHIIFPEINYDKVQKIRGFNITIVTSAKNNEEGVALLEEFGFPFRQQ